MKLRPLASLWSGSSPSAEPRVGDRLLSSNQQRRSWRLEQKIGVGYVLAIGIAVVGSVAGLLVSDYYQGRKITEIIDAQLQVKLFQDYEQAAQAVQVYGLRLLLDDRTPDQLQAIEQCLDESLQKAEELTRFIQQLAVGDRSWFTADTAYEDELQQLLQGAPSPLANTPENLAALFEGYTDSLHQYVEQVDLDVRGEPDDPNAVPSEPSVPTVAQVNALNSDMLDELDAHNQKLQGLIQEARNQELRAAQLIERVQGLEKLIVVGSILTAAILAGVLAWRTTRAITQPIKSVVQTAQLAALNQDYSLRASVESHDEIRTLAIALNQLIESVAERTQALQDSAQAAEDQASALASTLNALRTAQLQLVQTEKMSSLGQLLAGVAHEINNPVNFIHGNVEYARQYVDNLFRAIALYEAAAPTLSESERAKLNALELEFIREDLPKLLRSIATGSERIHNLVLSLRIFSRLNEAEMKRVDLHQGLDSTLEILGHRLKPRGQRPEIRLMKSYGDCLEAECNGGQMNQVFMNILSNAIDALEDEWSDRQASGQVAFWQPLIEITTRCYCTIAPFDTPSQPEISEAAEPDADNSVIDAPGMEWIDIQICNNGTPIPDVALSRIFDPFFSTKATGKGTGLGLSISYDIIVDKHRGRLLIASNEAGNVTFQIQIPVHFRRGSRHVSPAQAASLHST